MLLVSTLIRYNPSGNPSIFIIPDLFSRIGIPCKSYSGEIKICHLLNQTSGLDEVFFPLLDKIIKDPAFRISTREALLWGRQNLKPRSEPGKKHLYGDTNYYLLGLIVESIRKKSFQEVMHQLVFEPQGMLHAYMNDFTQPKKQSPYPTAGVFHLEICDRTGDHA